MHGLTTLHRLNQQAADHHAEKRARANHAAVAAADWAKLPQGARIAVYPLGEKRYEASFKGNTKLCSTFAEAQDWLQTWNVRQGV